MAEWKAEYKYQARYYEKKREWFKKFRLELRKEIVSAYGGKCACCGESHWEFLTIDHPNGNGQKDRKKHRMRTGQLYGWLKKKGFPRDGYRILCMNCNWFQRFSQVCPHEHERTPTL